MSEPGAAEVKEVSFFKDLIHRRVPQIIGVYIAVSWGIVQFTDWIVNRYLLSPHLVDLALVILMSLIPSSLIIAYFHGRPGRDKWKKPEKFGIPVNIVITALLAFFVFSGKDLSKVSQKVTLEDETGKKIERTIPKTQFRKKIVLFYFKNETGDTSLDWLQYGITHMLEFDLIQDLFIEILSPGTMAPESADFYIYNKIKEAGYKDGIGLPLLLKKKIAEEAIQKTLKIHPFNPKSNYEMALVYLEMGDKEKALKHLKIASEVWKDADPHYKPAKLAREKLSTL